MKKVLLTLAVLGGALAQQNEKAVAPAEAATGGAGAGADAAVQPALDLITEAMAKTKTAAREEAALCKAEQKSTQEWHDLVSSPDSLKEIKEARQARKAAKRELAAALGKRLKVLQEFLEKLYKARQRLGTHIERVNGIFQDVYSAVTDAQVDAAEAIKLLGISISQPHSPLFKPIKLPKKDKLDMEGEAASAQDSESSSDESAALDTEASTDKESSGILPGVPTPTAVTQTSVPEGDSDIDTSAASSDSSESLAATEADASAAEADAAAEEEKAKEDAGEPADPSLAEATSLSSLMELEARVASHVAECVGTDCNKAYTSAFGLYKYTYGVNKGNAVHFEKERESLGGFRDGLKALIKKKEDKMAALSAQLKELEASLANPGPTLESLFGLIKKHLDVNIEACSLMAGRTSKMLSLLSDGGETGFYELLKAGKLDCAGDPPAVKVEHEEVQEVASTSAETPEPVPSATKVAAPAALPAAPKPETIEIPDVPDVTAVDIPVAQENDEQTEIGSEVFDQQIGEVEHEQAKK